MRYTKMNMKCCKKFGERQTKWKGVILVVSFCLYLYINLCVVTTIQTLIQTLHPKSSFYIETQAQEIFDPTQPTHDDFLKVQLESNLYNIVLMSYK
jgi:hypothetical protein